MLPNRTLDLTEIRSPAYTAVLREMDDLLARDPVSYLHPSKRWEYPWALERADLPPGARVLDAGCGDSIFPIYLAACGYDVTAVDRQFTPGLARIHRQPVRYLRGDITSLPQRDASFDAVFCISVIEHLPEELIPLGLAELRRVLKPGARLLLTTDYYQDASAEIWYEDADRRFPVDWGVFDSERLRRYVLEAPGLELEGELDLTVDWEATRPRMRAFHGYPYTSVGLALVRA